MSSVPAGGGRKLGQNFLIDQNILDVIERHARLGPDDVVLEIGGGLGVLSARLGSVVRHVHVVEVDRRLEHRLRAALPDNATLHLADALELDLASLVPAPNRIVANLPYGIAATIVLRTIDELPGVSDWLVMIQREVGERLAASPGSGAYGATSVLAQLACDVSLVRSIPRSVFRPVPNVDSVLVSLQRHGGFVDEGARELVHGAFAHRRKALPRSLSLAGERGGLRSLLGDRGEQIRERAQEALRELGHPSDERAERLSPDEFRQLAAILAR